LVKKRDHFFPSDVEYIRAEIDRVVPESNQVLLADGRVIQYDQLVIASGTSSRPDQTPGMDDPAVLRKSVFDFYTELGLIWGWAEVLDGSGEYGYTSLEEIEKVVAMIPISMNGVTSHFGAVVEYDLHLGATTLRRCLQERGQVGCER
jgi:hypothetical protein